MFWAEMSFECVTIRLFSRVDVYVAALAVNVIMAHAVVYTITLYIHIVVRCAVLNELKTLFSVFLPVKHMAVWGTFVHSHFRLQHC